MPGRAITLGLALALALAGAAGAQEDADSVRGYTLGQVYRVTVRRVHVESVDVKYPDKLRLEGYQTSEQTEFRFRYLDRIEELEPGRVSVILRHFVKAARVTGEREQTLDLEQRRIRILCEGRGRLAFAHYDGTELSPELLELVRLSIVPQEPSELGPTRKRDETLVRVKVSNTWPGQNYRTWPRVVTSGIVPGWAPEIQQGNWKTRFEGDMAPEGQASISLRIFGTVDAEEDGIPVTHKRGRERRIEVEVNKADDNELPISYEEVIAEIRDLIAQGETDQARERYRYVEENLALKMPDHLREELGEVEQALR